MNKQTFEIVIIGGGASGMLVFLELSKLSSAKPINIVVVDPREQLGPGRAYSTSDQEHLLNVPAARMSLDPENPQDFLEWIQSRYSEKNFDHWPFVPRLVYGNYICDRIKSAREKTPLLHIKKKIVHISPKGARYRLTTNKGTLLSADAVVIATGYGTPLNHSTLAQDHIFDCATVTSMDLNSTAKNILIIGTGLSSIDMWRSARNNPQTNITLFSRHGLTPLPQIQTNLEKAIKTPPDNMNPRQLLSYLRAHRPEVSWRAIADKVRPKAQRIWSTWSQWERRQFLRHLKHYWEVARHRMPVTVFNELQHDISTGKVRILSGRILKIERKNKFNIVYQPRFETQEQTLVFDFIIKATGTKIDQSLSTSLKKCGVITCSHGFGYLGEAAPRIWSAGPSSKSQYWEITAIPEIRAQAKAIAKKIVDCSEISSINLNLQKFTTHPSCAGESYKEHLKAALMFCGFLSKKVFMIISHAIAPWTYPDNVSNDLRELSAKMSRRRRRFI